MSERKKAKTKTKTKKSAAQLEIGTDIWKEARRNDPNLSARERAEVKADELDEKLPPLVEVPEAQGPTRF
ncbi:MULTISPECIES: hypothetical protein [unclassified Stenotrophomonas]|uniref:hypothetical protein n=1 Tax=unclassified Stenotrophomonas TaxID=196198 RepID=UPI003012C120